jgi:pilus assembly protein CpaB
MKTPGDSSNRVVRKIRVRAILFLMLALIAGGGAVLLVKNYIDRVDMMRGGPLNITKVVVAAIDVPVGTVLAEQHVKLVSWPADNMPVRSFDKVDKVLNKTTRQALVKGEPVLQDRLVGESAGMGLTAILPKGKRAMTVKVDQVVGVAGFVRPGDNVDVITTMAPDKETRKNLKEEPAKISKIILQNIKVLAVGEHMQTQGTKPVKVSVVTLEVDPQQSERLALASRHGAIQLTMRSRIDQDSIPTPGVTPVALLAPDEGTEEEKEKAKEKAAAAADKSTQQWLAVRRRRRRPRKVAKKEEPPKPAAPVVEVLRGRRIEERKLRPTADSK